MLFLCENIFALKSKFKNYIKFSIYQEKHKNLPCNLEKNVIKYHISECIMEEVWQII